VRAVTPATDIALISALNNFTKSMLLYSIAPPLVRLTSCRSA
jgi:hypothetical protein